MTLLKGTGLKIHPGDRRLFHIPTLAIHDGDRIGLIGKNGSGKSTLLKILVGEELPDEGTISRISGISYLPQSLTQETPTLSGGEAKKQQLYGLMKNPCSPTPAPSSLPPMTTTSFKKIAAHQWKYRIKKSISPTTSQLHQ
jgi:ATPase components of ABC transporters with duplicated ATPase domains